MSDALADIQPTEGERELLQALPEVLPLLDALAAGDAQLVRSVVLTLTRGMCFDLTTFSRTDGETPVALHSTAQLDEYCYFVAGCVGEFFADISIAHTPALAHWDANEMRTLGVRFGKALQMTNILRDLPRDLRNGRCYLPKSALECTGLTPIELLDPAHGSNARPALIWGIRKTLDHFDAAERYIIAIPPPEFAAQACRVMARAHRAADACRACRMRQLVESADARQSITPRRVWYNRAIPAVRAV